jgi:hypothetical protein
MSVYNAYGIGNVKPSQDIDALLTELKENESPNK